MENNIAPDNEILKLTNVTKDFYPALPFSKLLTLDFKPDKPTRALDDVSFSLERGKVLGILGPNGAGKTTLLKIISGIVLQDKGTVEIGGMSFDSDGDRIRSMVGLSAYQEKSFYWRLTGRQNLEFFAALYGLGRDRTKERIEELSGALGAAYLDKRFDAYSAGMKQTLSIMRSLLHDPGLILLDEPTKSLDYMAAKRLIAFVKEELCKKRGRTIIITTHQMSEALESADIFMIMDRGIIAASGTLAELRHIAHKDGASLGEIFIGLTG